MVSEIIYRIYCLPISATVLIMLLLTPGFGVLFALVKQRWFWIVLSALSVFFILYLTVFSRECVRKETPELIPFSFIVRAQEQPELYREIVLNIFLFWPLGLFLPHVLGKHPVLTTILFACVFSITIETIQYFFVLGLTETDDVIANTVGAAIGTISFLIAKRKRS